MIVKNKNKNKSINKNKQVQKNTPCLSQLTVESENREYDLMIQTLNRIKTAS